MPRSRRVVLTVVAAVVAISVLVLLVVLYTRGTRLPLVLTIVAVSCMPVALLSLWVHNEGGRLWRVVTGTTVALLIVVGVPVLFIVRDNIGLALISTLALTAIGIAFGLSLDYLERWWRHARRWWRHARQWWHYAHDRGHDRDDSNDRMLNHPRRKPFELPPGSVPASAQYVGAVVPTATVLGLLSSSGLALSSTGKTVLDAIISVGGVLTIAVVVYVVQHLLLQWFERSPLPPTTLDRVANDARERATEATSIRPPEQRELVRRDAQLALIRSEVERGGNSLSNEPQGDLGAHGTFLRASHEHTVRELEALQSELRRVDSKLRVFSTLGEVPHSLEKRHEELQFFEHRLDSSFERLNRSESIQSLGLAEEMRNLHRQERERVVKAIQATEMLRRRSHFDDSRFRISEARGGPLARITRPFGSSAAAEACVRAASDFGLVLDAVWPRIQLVMPADQRREVARRERMLSAYRLVAASALLTALVVATAAALTATAILLLPAAGAAGITGLATVAGRRELVRVYQNRLAVTEIRRFDLLHALRMESPQTTLDLVRLGAVLSDGDPPTGRPVHDERAIEAFQTPALNEEHLANLSQTLAEQLPERLSAQLSVELRRQVDRLNRSPARVDIGRDALGALAKQIADQVTSPLQGWMGELERSVLEKVRETVEHAVVGEPLSPFSGFLIIELDDAPDAVTGASGRVSASAGSELRVALSILDDPRGRTAAPERGSPDDFLAVQPIHIPGDTRLQKGSVDFELIVDSPSLTPSPHRAAVRINPGGRERKTISFALPDVPGEHEAWIQLYQSGRLVEVVALPIEVVVGSPSVSDQHIQP